MYSQDLKLGGGAQPQGRDTNELRAELLMGTPGGRTGGEVSLKLKAFLNFSRKYPCTLFHVALHWLLTTSATAATQQNSYK